MKHQGKFRCPLAHQSCPSGKIPKLEENNERLYVLNNDCIASDHITAICNFRTLTFKRLPPGSGLEELKANQVTSVWFGMVYFTLYGSLVDKSHIEKHLKNPDVQDELTSNVIRARTDSTKRANS